MVTDHDPDTHFSHQSPCSFGLDLRGGIAVIISVSVFSLRAKFLRSS